VTLDQNMRVTENSVIYTEGSEKSVNNIDWPAEFSVTYMIWPFITHGLYKHATNITYMPRPFSLYSFSEFCCFYFWCPGVGEGGGGVKH
jgi:hypothetical protein